MKIITEKLQGSKEQWSLADSVNTCIHQSSIVDEYKKKFGIKKTPKENTLEFELYKKKGCLVASPNEIYDWLKEHNPTDKRLKHHFPNESDNDKMLWCVHWNISNKEWELMPWRNVGKRTKSCWEKELKSHKFGLTYFI